MAIVVEEGRAGGTGILKLLVWIAVMALIAWGVYYVAFKKPELIPAAPAPQLRDAELVSKLKLDPQAVVGKIQPPAFVGHKVIAPPSTSGRSNPFAAF